VTVNAIHFPSGDIAGWRTVTTRYQSASVKARFADVWALAEMVTNTKRRTSFLIANSSRKGRFAGQFATRIAGKHDPIRWVRQRRVRR
jgi:hypothetical protein